jgi:kynureninase
VTRRPRVPDLARQAATLDAADPLAGYRSRFAIAADGLIYLDGNSLGRLPLATRERLHQVIDEQWGTDLIRGWDRWMDLSRQVGDVLAPLLGAQPGEVILSDSTTVNLYKLASAALDTRPQRRVIVTDDDNFPTDRYVLQGLCDARGLELRLIESDPNRGVTRRAVAGALSDEVALVSLSHVAYRSGAIADLAGITAAATTAGALTIWDLSHSAGSVPIGLADAGVELAVGCTYKHLNGGPGAPAFLYVASHLQTTLRQPIWGWFGQSNQFDMGPVYDPVPGIERFLCGTPPILAGYAALCGAELSAEAGIEAIYTKARALTSYAQRLYEHWLRPHGFELASPSAAKRGAHLTLAHPRAWQYCQAWKAAGVIPDFRTPDRLRIGVAPLYTSFGELHAGFARLRDIAQSGSYADFPAVRGRVT